MTTTTASSDSLPSGLPIIANNRVTVVGPSDRLPKPCLAASGLLREVCLDDGHAWVAFATAAPGAASPWHDHGARTTCLLLLQGECVVEFSDGRVQLVADGSVCLIPPGLRHRELNPGAVESRCFIARF